MNDATRKIIDKLNDLISRLDNDDDIKTIAQAIGTLEGYNMIVDLMKSSELPRKNKPLGLSCSTCNNDCKNETICVNDHHFRWTPMEEVPDFINEERWDDDVCSGMSKKD